MKTIRIYSDESRHKNERFMLLGGIWIEEKNVSYATSQIKKLRNYKGYKNSSGKHIDFLGEFKWQKVSNKYFHVYKELVDIFFEWINKDTARFCCMLIDRQNPVIQKENNIDEDGYFKLLYQLYFHNSKIPAIYKIFPDSISNSTVKVNLPKLDLSLDSSFRNKFIPLLNPKDEVPKKGFVNNITPIDSKSNDLIQVVDVIIGAIGYLQNSLFRKKRAKVDKVKLMKYIFEKMALSGAILVSGKTYYVAKSTKFNIWVFKPTRKIYR
jgi:hypothetical protein